MPSRQYELCVSVLRRMRDAGVLDNLVLVGSWCLILYREYFKGIGSVHAVRTRDMDFLVPPSARFTGTVNLPELLRDLGFIRGFRGEAGYVMLQHPELMIEFLVPERGRGKSGAWDLPQLGMNAQPLRFMDVALMMTVRMHFGDVALLAPHPAAFALQKLLVAPRRQNREKKQKDLDDAIHVLRLLARKGEVGLILRLLERFPRSWKETVARSLKAAGQADLQALLDL